MSGLAARRRDVMTKRERDVAAACAGVMSGVMRDV